MVQDWKVEKVMRPERVFEKIGNLQKPVIVVVFGANMLHKKVVFDAFCERMVGHDAPRVVATREDSAAEELCEAENLTLIRLRGSVSCEWDERKKFIEALRASGPASLVGVYAKLNSSHCWREDPNGDEQLARANQAAFLRAFPPAPEEWDYLVTVRE